MPPQKVEIKKLFSKFAKSHFRFLILTVRYHTGGSMKLNARILYLAYLVYL